jgi:hypothetical protein
MFSKASIPTLLCALLLQACSPIPTQIINRGPTASAEPTLVASAEATAQPTATPPSTVGPTATVWPPVFDLYSFTDIRSLNSFVVTINEKNTINGQLTEGTSTIGYIKEPYSAYSEDKNAGGVDRMYSVDGWTYKMTSSGDWYISVGSNDDVFSRADIPAGNTEKLGEAQFSGEEDFQGIPAYHFVLPPNSTDANTGSQLEGDFYLARDGNYVLYSHSKETSSQGNFTQVYEVTESLSSINQPIEIKLPADMQQMAVAVEVPAKLGLPLPENSALERMTRYQHGIGVDLYYFGIPKMSDNEFLDFYRNLPTTDGWQVTHVGHVSLHEADCELSRECVMISKGSTQVILYYDGFRLRAEFDWPHLYSPL